MHGNERLVREAYEAMGRGEGKVLAGMLTPTTRWRIPGDGRLSGTYEGPDAIFGLWKGIAEQTGGGLRLEVIDVLANDVRAVALIRATGEREGRQLDERQIAVFEIEDGKVTEATFVYEDSEAYDAFWS